MDVKGKVFLQLFNKSKLRNGTKTHLKPKFFSIYIVKFKKLRFSAPLISILTLLFLYIKNILKLFGNIAVTKPKNLKFNKGDDFNSSRKKNLWSLSQMFYDASDEREGVYKIVTMRPIRIERGD